MKGLFGPPVSQTLRDSRGLYIGFQNHGRIVINRIFKGSLVVGCNRDVVRVSLSGPPVSKARKKAMGVFDPDTHAIIEAWHHVK